MKPEKNDVYLVGFLFFLDVWIGQHRWSVATRLAAVSAGKDMKNSDMAKKVSEW